MDKQRLVAASLLWLIVGCQGPIAYLPTHLPLPEPPGRPHIVFYPGTSTNRGPVLCLVPDDAMRLKGYLLEVEKYEEQVEAVRRGYLPPTAK